jgi:hypothetical protein
LGKPRKNLKLKRQGLVGGLRDARLKLGKFRR